MGFYQDDDVSAECAVCDRVFDRSSNWRANENSMKQHMQVHYLSCPTCDKQFEDRQGNRAALRERLAKHVAARHEDVTATCATCYRVFNHSTSKRANINSLEEHMQVHKPRTVSCPACGETRFRSPTNAVQHFESGACTSCLGRERARATLHGFVASRQETVGWLVSRPMLQYSGSSSSYGAVPERPYNCGHCDKTFKDLSSKMQHEERSHQAAPRRLALR